MPLHKQRGRAMSWLVGTQEELAKKDDDLNVSRQPRSGGQWQPARVPRRRTLLRVTLLVVVAVLLIMVFSNMQSFRSSDLAGKPFPGGTPPPPPNQAPAALEDAGRKSTSKGKSNKNKGSSGVELKKDYVGPVKFPRLGETLHAIGGTQGQLNKNRNVLFAAASHDSVATLLPLACEMAEQRQNYVHFALMGRSEVPLQELKKMNGIHEDCPMILHDARPDHASISTEPRMMMCTARAMHFINQYMHPQAIFVDSTVDEEHFFLTGLRDQVRSVKGSLIELPSQAGTRFSWITKLDTVALAAWDKIHIDILIHAPAHGAGNLQRLLRSLAELDMGGMPTPQLTVELPNNVDPLLQNFLSSFQWPPPTSLSGHRPHMLTLRHRISRSKLTEEESAVRFLESYWPMSPEYSHVLVLSPHTEVTPQFLHYVKYALLYYRYSNAARANDWGMNMMGLSFSFPPKLLDESGPLALPQPSEEAGASFMWQGPSSEATLFSGSKWMELHGYISQVLERQHSSSESPALLSQKDVSKKYPTWLEYVLQLSRLRGYFTVYPGQETSSVILGVHNDIPDVPEEYEDDEEARKAAEGDGVEDEATYLFDPHWSVDIMQTLPRGGSLPRLDRLPIVSWEGKETSLSGIGEQAEKFTARFRREVGQCAEGDEKKVPNRQASDLFCSTSES